MKCVVFSGFQGEFFHFFFTRWVCIIWARCTYRLLPVLFLINFSVEKHKRKRVGRIMRQSYARKEIHSVFWKNNLDKEGHAVAQLVEALRYKPEGRGFDSRWCHWNFSLTISFQPHYGPGVDSASNRNEYQEYFLGGKGGRCVGLTALPPSCADCLEIWEPQPPGTLRDCPGL